MMRTLVLCLAALLALSGAVPAAEEGNHDPVERVNRGVFWFNDQLDIYVLEPVAKGWDAVVPRRVQHAVANFFGNLRFPVVAVNDLLQAKLVHAGGDVARFAVNTTVGGLGFFDPASQVGLEQHDEDFGQTLGVWGVPAGPYLVLPLVGPSSLRDAPALVVDMYTAVYPVFVPLVYTVSAQGVSVVNGRAQVLDQVREAKNASVDYYSAVRSGFVQRRQSLVTDGAELSTEEQEDLYRIETNGDSQ